jgi:hypothetical protein
VKRVRGAVALIVLTPWVLSAQAPAVPVDVAPSLDARRDHVQAIAAEAAARYVEWLGPAPFERATIVDRPGSAPDPSGVTVAVGLPWAGSPDMALEAEVASGLAAAWFPGLAGGEQPALSQGVVRYLQSHIVERLFNLRRGVSAYRLDGVRLFGGSLFWPTPSLRLGRYAAGLGRDDAGGDPLVVRVALAFGTLERWRGWPTVQSALRALAQRSQRGPMSARAAVDTLSSAMGQDLSWLFDQVLDPAATFDYALESVAVAPPSAACEGCYRTDVMVFRRGTATFSGSARQPAGDFQAGDALEIRVRFGDGQMARATWDGRAERHTVAFESAAPPAQVWLDPDRVLLLDEDPLNGSRSLPPGTNVPVMKWAARWLVWLQDAAIACTALL